MLMESTKETKENTSKYDKNLMTILMNTPNLLQWSKDLMNMVVAYTHEPPIYLFGESSFTRLHHHDGIVEKLPILSKFRRRCSINRVKDNIYVIGGYHELTGASSSVERFHIPTSTWSLLPPMSIPRYWHVSVVIGNHIYVIGGQGGNGLVYSSSEVFDIKANKWTVTCQPMVVVRNGAIGTAVLDKIYIFGGEYLKLVDHVEVFNITMSWTTLTPLKPMKHDHSKGCVVAIDNVRILVMGGYHYDHRENSTVEEYNIVTNTWRTMDWELPDVMSGFAAWYDEFNQILHVAFGNEESNYHYVRSLKSYVNNNNNIDVKSNVVINDNTTNNDKWTLIPHSSRYQTNFGYCT
jgi:N-acetylneuraminic acid mutarotase